MKAILPYIIMFVGTLLSAVLVMGLLLMTKPEMFGGGQPPEMSAAESPAEQVPPEPEMMPADTPDAPADTLRAATADTPPSAPATGDPLPGVKMPSPDRRDSVVFSSNQAAPTARAHAQSDSAARPAPSVTMADSLRARERREMAKVFDAMPAENAARILNDLPDSEVKEILLAVKKRQAARILAALDPGRAARIMR